MHTRLLERLGFILLALPFMGCVAEAEQAFDNGVAQQSTCGAGHLDIVWDPAVVQLDASQIASKEQLQGGTYYQPMYKVTFAGTAPLIGNGSVVALEGPNGFYGTVHNLVHASTLPDGTVTPATAVIVTEGLDSAVDSLQASTDLCDGPANAKNFAEQSFKLANVKILAREGNLEDVEFSLGNTQLIFTPDWHVDVSVRRPLPTQSPVIDYVRIKGGFNIELPYEIAMAAKASGSITGRGTIPTPIRFLAMAGPVPLWIEMNGGIDIDFHGAGEFRFNAAGNATVNFAFEAVYDPSQAQRASLAVTEPSVQVTGSRDAYADFDGAAELGVWMGIGIYIAGVAGPSISVGPYLRMEGCKPELRSDQPEQACEAGWNLSLGAGALFGVEANNLLPVNLAARTSVDLFNEPLANGDNTPTPAQL